MSDEPRIEQAIEDGTAVVTMFNPNRRNAFTPDTRRALTNIILALAEDDSVRAIVLRGDGVHFCAGADVTRMPKVFGQNSVAAARANMNDVHRLLIAIVGSPKPIIAAVEGDAFGAGMSIAVACDTVIASAESRFGAAFTKLGLLPDMGLLYTLPQRIGLPKAKSMMMLSTAVGGPEAVALGIADELAPAGGTLAAAMAHARQFQSLAPVAIAMIKAAYARGIHTLEDAMGAEVDVVPFLQKTADFAEGVTAFREKRAPNFTGR